VTELSQEQVIERAHQTLESGEDTGQRVIAVLIILVTVLAAGTALLERTASTHQAYADRHARTQAVVAVGAEVRANTSLSEEIVLHHAATNLTRLSEDFAVHKTGPGAAHAQALAAAFGAAGHELDGFRAEFFAQFRKSDGSFDYDRFYAASQRPRYAAQEWAAAYARERGDYASKRGFYIAVITIFAVSLFLLGLTLTVPSGHRGLFLGAGSAFGLAGVVLGLVIWARPVAHPSREAILSYAYAASVDASEGDQPIEADRSKYLRVIAAARRAIRFRHDYEKAYLLRADNEAHLDLIAENGPHGSPAALDDYAEAVRLEREDYFAWVNYAVGLFWAKRFTDALRVNTTALEIQSHRPIVNINQALYVLMRDSVREGTARVVRSRDYRKQLANVRTTLANAPNRSREIAMTGSIHDTDLMLKYRPEYTLPTRASLEDLLRIDHELDASLEKTTPGPYPQSSARAAIAGLSFSGNQAHTHLTVDVCFSRMVPSDERLYYVYVNRERVAETGPFGWRENGLDLPSTQQRTKTFNLRSVPDPSARVRVEVFVNGHVRAVRSLDVGKRFDSPTSVCSSA
jgi:uncharacterized membrane protein YidH (DUF202 family)